MMLSHAERTSDDSTMHYVVPVCVAHIEVKDAVLKVTLDEVHGKL